MTWTIFIERAAYVCLWFQAPKPLNQKMLIDFLCTLIDDNMTLLKWFNIPGQISSMKPPLSRPRKVVIIHCLDYQVPDCILNSVFALLLFLILCLCSESLEMKFWQSLEGEGTHKYSALLPAKLRGMCLWIINSAWRSHELDKMSACSFPLANPS